MPGIRETAQFVNGRWWFLKNGTSGSGVSTGGSKAPTNGRWWFLRGNSTQAFGNAEANSRKFVDPSKGPWAQK